MSVMPKVVNGFFCKFVCTVGMGPRTNLYRIGGDPLTQLHLMNFFLNFVSSEKTLTVRKLTETILLVTHLPTYAINRTFQPKHSTSNAMRCNVHVNKSDVRLSDLTDIVSSRIAIVQLSPCQNVGPLVSLR